MLIKPDKKAGRGNGPLGDTGSKRTRFCLILLVLLVFVLIFLLVFLCALRLYGIRDVDTAISLLMGRKKFPTKGRDKGGKGRRGEPERPKDDSESETEEDQPVGKDGHPKPHLIPPSETSDDELDQLEDQVL